MPLHAWEKVDAGSYHHFHQMWATTICIYLNDGRLPESCDALVEQRKGKREGDVLAIELFPKKETESPQSHRSKVTALERPNTSLIRESEQEYYSRKADRIVVRHKRRRIVAIIEVISPGKKDRKSAVRGFVDKTLECVNDGVHVLVIDPFPPSKYDPDGIHKSIWDEIGEDEPFEFPKGRDRLTASYEIANCNTAFVECIGVGEALPRMPLFLKPGFHVMIDLEETYQNALKACPKSIHWQLTFEPRVKKRSK